VKNKQYIKDHTSELFAGIGHDAEKLCKAIKSGVAHEGKDFAKHCKNFFKHTPRQYAHYAHSSMLE
jgi:hypothetical protein